MFLVTNIILAVETVISVFYLLSDDKFDKWIFIVCLFAALIAAMICSTIVVYKTISAMTTAKQLKKENEEISKLSKAYEKIFEK